MNEMKNTQSFDFLSNSQLFVLNIFAISKENNFSLDRAVEN